MNDKNTGTKMKTTLKRGFGIVLIMGLSLMICLSSFMVPKPREGRPGEAVFSAVSAKKSIEEMAKVPHPMGSSENKEVQRYLIERIREMGLECEIQKGFSTCDIYNTEGEVENLITRVKGYGGGKDVILMMAHYDSTKWGPGAADDSMGVAVLLETMKHLQSYSFEKKRPLLKNDILFLITDGEEEGMLGASYFTSHSKAEVLDPIKLVLNFEARGNKGFTTMFETGENNGWLMDEYRKARVEAPAYSFTYEIYKTMPNNTDFTLFKRIQKNGLNFATLDGFESYHNEHDNSTALDMGTLQQMGNNAFKALHHFGDLALDRAVPGGQPQNAVFFSLSRGITVVYSNQLVMPLAIGAFMVFVMLGVELKKKKLLRWKECLISILCSVGLIGGSVGVGMLLPKVYERFFDFNGTGEAFLQVQRAYLEGSKPLMAVAVILFGLIMSAVYRGISRKASRFNVFYGTMSIWVVLSMLTAAYYQGISYLFVWPLLFMELGLLIGVMDGEDHGEWRNWAMFGLTTLSCILIFLPFAYLILLALTVSGAGVVTGILVLPLEMIMITMGNLKGGTKEGSSGTEDLSSIA